MRSIEALDRQSLREKSTIAIGLARERESDPIDGRWEECEEKYHQGGEQPVTGLNLSIAPKSPKYGTAGGRNKRDEPHA